MKLFKNLLLTVLLVVLGASTAYAAGSVAGQHDGGRRADHQAVAQDTPPAPADDPVAAPDSPSPVVATPEPEKPAFELRSGDRGVRVRELQYRLFELDWFPELTTGRFGPDTVVAVKGFQDKRGLRATGVVDARTWHRLVAMTHEPTQDQLHNVLHPGPALFSSGDRGDEVRDLQARLKAIAWYFGDVTGTYDHQTVQAVKGFQGKREIPVTGEVDQRTLDRLHAMTYTPTHDAMYNIEARIGALDPRCKTGRVLCVDKTSRTLRWVVDGKVLKTLDARFGSTLNDTPTREGLFHVYSMDADHVSNLYGSSMPFAMFFSGGQAVHYSSDFATVGYYGASHGCVNIRDYDGIKWLFGQVRVGDKVVVYWS